MMNQEEHQRMQRMAYSLRIIKEYNRLANDLDAYLYELCRYGLGETPFKPNRKDYLHALSP